MTRIHIATPLMLALALSACGEAADQTGTTRAEEQQLDEAAAALDATQQDFEAAVQTAEPVPAEDDAAEH